MKYIITALFFISTLGLISTAFAEKGEHHDGPCKEDFQKFCKDVKPGEGAIMKCMKGHEADFSQGCKDFQAQMKGKMKGFWEACKKDLMTTCKDAQAGHGAKFDCLKKNEASLDPTCKAALAKGPKTTR